MAAGAQDIQRSESIVLQQQDISNVAEAEETVVTPGLRHSRIRDLIHVIINESLRVGGRPDSAVAEETDGGEIIEVRSKTADGETRVKTIEWSVDAKIPEVILGVWTFVFQQFNSKPTANRL